MDEKLKSENHSYYVVIVNVFAVILCIVYFCIYFILWAVVSAGYQALFSSSYFEVTNRFTALEAAQNEVAPEDLWKGTKTVLLEVARETIGSIKSQRKRNGYLMRLTQQSGKREKQKAKTRNDIKN